MIEARKKLLAEIDNTIDELIKNKAMQKQIASSSDYTFEKIALQKTEESLLSHLIHLQSHLEEKKQHPPQTTIKQMLSTSRIRYKRRHVKQPNH